MLGLDWSELAVIAVVALVVIGPKDLPRVMRTVGLYVRKARGMAAEFQGHLNDLAQEAELADLRKTVDQARSLDLRGAVERALDPDGSVSGDLGAAFAEPPPVYPSIMASPQPVRLGLPAPLTDLPAADPVPGLPPEILAASMANYV